MKRARAPLTVAGTGRSNAGELVGRAAERHALERVLAAVEQGASAVVVVTGEPGIGKTRLLDELAGQADARKHLVLLGKASEFERDLPLGAFVDALDAYVASLPPQELRALGEDRLAELIAVMPGLRPVTAGAGSTLHEERFRLLRAMQALLEHLAARQPLVLALDDVHWADSASLELIQYLLRHRPRARVLLALALRPGQAPRSLARALTALVIEQHDERIELLALSRADADTLLGSGLDADTRAAIYRESGGNPFYLVELARRVPRDMAVAISGNELAPPVAPGELPALVALALGEEIETLSERARTVTRAAAVAGERFDTELVAAAAALPEADVLAGVDELCARELIRTTEVPREFRFRHPLVRRAVYETAQPGWLLGAHERLASALAARGAPVAVRAPHVARSARTGDPDAVALLATAARETHARAPAIAANWYQAALRLLPPEAVAERAELLVPLATALGATGRLEDSLRVLHEALALLPPGAWRPRVQLVAFCAAIEHLLGRHREAHERLLAALPELPDEPSPAAAALAIELAADAIYMFDSDTTVRWATRARETAQVLGDVPALATSTALIGYGHWHAGRPAAAEPHRAEAAALVDRLDDPALAARLDAPYYLGWVETFQERFDDALRHFDRGIALSRTTGQGYLYVPMMCGKGYTLASLGRLTEAAEAAQRATESSRLAENHQGLVWALFTHCWTAAAMGDVPLALRLGEEAVTLGGQIGAHVLLPPAAEFYALALLLAGDPARAVEVLLANAGGPELPGWGAGTRCHASAILCEAELARGDRAAAERWATFTERTAAALSPLRRPESLAARSRAALLLSEGDPRRAAALALEAVDAAEAVGCRIEEGRARTLAGRALVAAGDREAAIEQLLAAERALAACGARRWRDEAASELRALGRPPARTAAATPRSGVLSRREREIAVLIAEGKTNKQIGVELFISERTVETHVRHILQKFGVSSRAAVASALARESRAGEPV
jgi:ATP/maltotriose-dependent transcriptional regulator MalT